MEIGFGTDEISSDVKKAIETGVSWGIRNFELRVIEKNRIPNISEKKVDQLLDLKKQFNINFTALSPGTFKNRLENRAQIEKDIDQTLPRVFRLAKLLGAKIVIVFGIQRSTTDIPEDEKKVIEIFQRVAVSAQMESITIAVENEPGFWCDTGTNTARILQKVNSPALRANWDPANAVGAEKKPFPGGYNILKKWIANVHIKDTVKGALIECVPVGMGIVDWHGQLKAIVADKTVETVTIETHCPPLMENSKKNLARVRQMLSEFSASM